MGQDRLPSTTHSPTLLHHAGVSRHCAAEEHTKHGSPQLLPAHAAGGAETGGVFGLRSSGVMPHILPTHTLVGTGSSNEKSLSTGGSGALAGALVFVQAADSKPASV